MTLVVLILAVASLILALATQAGKVPAQTTVLVLAITLTVMAVVGWAGAR